MNKVVNKLYSTNKFNYDYINNTFNLNENVNKLYYLIQSGFSIWKENKNKIKYPIKRIV